MLSIERCRKILKDNGYKLNPSDNEIAMLRDFLMMVAMVENNNSSNTEEDE
jgi:hypothetical protein